MYFISLSFILLFSLYLKGNLLNDEKNWPAKLELFVTCHFHANVALQSTQADSGSVKGEVELATEMRDFIVLICIFFHPQQPPEKVCSSMKPLMV